MKISICQLCSLAFITLVTASTYSHALIIGFSGSAFIPASTVSHLTAGELQQNNAVFGINEKQQAEILQPILVDLIVDASIYGIQQSGLNSQPTAHFLRTGTYSSHILHFDPINAGNVFSAIFEFDNPIVAIIFSSSGSNGNLLSKSDAIFGLNNVNYQSSTQRRMENNDMFTILNATQISIDAARENNRWLDELRVLTLSQTITIPPTALLLLIPFLQLALKIRPMLENY